MAGTGVMHVSLYLAVVLIIIQVCVALGTTKLRSEKLCSQCSKCESNQCPPSESYPHMTPSESYPHMTAFDDSLIASALQSDHVGIGDRGVYSVPNAIGGVSKNSNSYYGWKSSSEGQTYLSVDKKGKVAIRSLKSLASLAQADWKSINPPSHLNHREVQFCNQLKRVLGVAECRFDGSNLNQLFGFQFRYHKAFCCCGIFNN
ncbi:hypothetical protein MKW94_005070 [Papaver nudicaule]|uniref:Uncharacterized protein n=1 Tax=Papaver nudicaule TaxID=74823 RepID=A0AA41S7R2_PAPNU|nr:hypothetical protein [Papaver nudicaule]